SVNAKTGKVEAAPEIFTRGFVYVRDSEQLLEECRKTVEKTLAAYAKEPHRELGSLKTKIREAAASFLYRRTKRSPMILPIIMEV
ncbi:RNase J family beta-CASP ribonuclease, partial [Ruminococcaceae bacterium OttesenSCG-928-O06]|nr:RNase J family beta-CASP ribonuclease [Ruminococcaceae bacterium OttesenSCG-928-O06]